jgi:pSer/pThr/pTyr-binding forkhead associated (FHA) protein
LQEQDQATHKHGTAARSPLASHRASPVELKEQLEALELGVPFFIYRDGDDRQHLVPLTDADSRLTIGRRRTNSIALHWDREVSRVHADIERLGSDWAIADDGLSQNGTFVNGLRISGRRRLNDRDEIRVGRTVIVYRSPSRSESATTLIPDDLAMPTLSETQLAVLTALCRPYGEAAGFATPATNRAIAEELSMSLDGVKSAMRVLFQKLAVEQLPQNEKRARLVERAFQLGIVQL